MLWIKSFHLIAVVAWFAGLFYLPRLFVYHAMATDTISLERFKIMEHKLYYIIMTPAAILTIILGAILASYHWSYYKTAGWFHFKLLLVFALIIYHVYCGKLIRQFKQDKNQLSTRFYRFFNEIPTLFLFAIIILTIVKPF